MPVSIGVDFGTRTLRLASLGEERLPQALGSPIPVWKLAGLPEELGAGLPIKSKIDKALKIGKEPVFLADIALRILLSLRMEAQTLLRADVEGCVVSTSWQAGSMQREILRSTAQKAGFKVVRLVNDSAAVALSQCNPMEGERKILVYSLGAGSLEVAIALRSRSAYRELAAGSLQELSGNTLTWRLFNSLLDELLPENLPDAHGLEAKIWEIAENVKVLLSSQEQVKLKKVMRGKDLVVTRQRLEALIQTDLVSSLELCQQLTEKAGLNTPSELDEIWLAGNSTRIPIISSMIASWSGKEPNQADEYAVAYGAAMQAAHLDLTKDVETQQTQEPPASPVSPFELFRPNLDTFRTRPAGSGKPMPVPEFDQTILDHVKEADQRLAREDFDGALEQLGEAMGFFQVRKARVYLSWGRYFEATGELDKALSKYQQAVQLDHENPENIKSLEAVKIKIRQEEAHLDYKRGRELEAKGDLSGASNSYKLAYEKNAIPEHKLAYIRTLYEKARNKIEQHNSFMNQRNLKMAKGVLKEAGKYLTECVRLDPANPDFRRKLEEVTLVLKRG